MHSTWQSLPDLDKQEKVSLTKDPEASRTHPHHQACPPTTSCLVTLSRAVGNNYHISWLTLGISMEQEISKDTRALVWHRYDRCYTTLKIPTSQQVLFQSVQFSLVAQSDFLRPHEQQHAWPPCPSPMPGVHPNPCPLLSWWCHPTISSSVVPFSCPQSFPASVSLPMSQLFTSGGQSIGVLASTSVLPMNTQDWSPLGWAGRISLQSKGLSRVFFHSNSTF